MRRQDGKVSKTLVFNGLLAVVTITQELSAILDVLPAGYVDHMRPWLLTITLIGNTVLRYFTTGPIGPTAKPLPRPKARPAAEPTETPAEADAAKTEKKSPAPNGAGD